MVAPWVSELAAAARCGGVTPDGTPGSGQWVVDTLAQHGGRAVGTQPMGRRTIGQCAVDDHRGRAGEVPEGVDQVLATAGHVDVGDDERGAGATDECEEVVPGTGSAEDPPAGLGSAELDERRGHVAVVVGDHHRRSRSRSLHASRVPHVAVRAESRADVAR